MYHHGVTSRTLPWVWLVINNLKQRWAGCLPGSAVACRWEHPGVAWRSFLPHCFGVQGCTGVGVWVPTERWGRAYVCDPARRSIHTFFAAFRRVPQTQTPCMGWLDPGEPPPTAVHAATGQLSVAVPGSHEGPAVCTGVVCLAQGAQCLCAASLVAGWCCCSAAAC